MHCDEYDRKGLEYTGNKRAREEKEEEEEEEEEKEYFIFHNT